MCCPPAAAMSRAQYAGQPGPASAFAGQQVCLAAARVVAEAVAAPAVAVVVPDLQAGELALQELRPPVAAAHRWMLPERLRPRACWPSADRFRCPYPRQRCGGSVVCVPVSARCVAPA